MLGVIDIISLMVKDGKVENLVNEKKISELVLTITMSRKPDTREAAKEEKGDRNGVHNKKEHFLKKWL